MKTLMQTLIGAACFLVSQASLSFTGLPDTPYERAVSAGCQPELYKRVTHLPVSSSLDRNNAFYNHILNELELSRSEPSSRPRDLLLLLDNVGQYTWNGFDTVVLNNQKLGICSLGQHDISADASTAANSNEGFRLIEAADHRALIRVSMADGRTRSEWLRDVFKLKARSELYLTNLKINGNRLRTKGALIAVSQASHLELRHTLLTRANISSKKGGPYAASIILANSEEESVGNNPSRNTIIIDQFSALIHDMSNGRSPDSKAMGMNLFDCNNVTVRGHSQLISYRGGAIQFNCGSLTIDQSLVGSMEGTAIRNIQPFFATGAEVSIRNSTILLGKGKGIESTKSDVTLTNNRILGCQSGERADRDLFVPVNTEEEGCNLVYDQSTAVFFSSPPIMSWFFPLRGRKLNEPELSRNLLTVRDNLFIGSIETGFLLLNQDRVQDEGGNQWMSSGTACHGSTIDGRGITFANGVPCFLEATLTTVEATREPAMETTTEPAGSRLGL